MTQPLIRFYESVYRTCHIPTKQQPATATKYHVILHGNYRQLDLHSYGFELQANDGLFIFREGKKYRIRIEELPDDAPTI